MPINKILLTTTAVIALAAGIATAQQTTTKTVKKVKPTIKVVLLPDFYHYERIKHGDTTYAYECYNTKEEKINVDEISDAKGINDIYFFKSYFGAAPRPGSPISAPYLSAKLHTYERTGPTSWVSTNRVTKEQMGVNEIVKTIVRKDTAYFPIAGTDVKNMVIHKYYKTELVAINAVPNDHSHSHNH